MCLQNPSITARGSLLVDVVYKISATVERKRLRSMWSERV